MHFLREADVKNKTVFVRADLDVPFADGKIEDDTRLLSAIPTINYLLKHNAKIIIAGHLGRPEGESYKARTKNKQFNLGPVAEWFVGKINHDSRFAIRCSKLGDFEGWEIARNVFLLENLRFYKEEEENDSVFSRKLADLVDIYINDAFAMCHRYHASVVGITHFLPHFAGLHLEKEVNSLTAATKNPKRPLVVIIGGKKIETKLPLVEKMHRIADYVLVGGKIAQETKILVKAQHEKIIGSKAVLLIADLKTDGSDITEKDAENFLQIINLAKTIIWNGSMGIVGGKSESLTSEKGSRKISEGIINSKAYSIVGGGDTIEFLNKLGILNKFSFASTGGGAMLSFLSGEKLPGLEVLES